MVYVESKSGTDFAGNIFRIVEELSTGKYGNFKIVVYAKENIHPKIRELEKNYSLNIDKIVSNRTTGTMIMEKAKYLITDSVLFHKFVKRPGQIVLNAWPGTPFKTFGFNNKNQQHKIAGVQETLLSSDYVLFSNDYTKRHFLSSYMLEKIYPGTILMGGSPRNSALFKSTNLKEELGLKDKEIFAYMPSFKSVKSFKDNDRKNAMENYFRQIDEKLNDNQILFVKLHHLNRDELNLDRYKNIKEFPDNYEPYDILNIADALISDYSEVIFDFANTGKKIILFVFDEERYFKLNETFIDLSQLPFPKVHDVDELIFELNSDENHDYAAFLDEYCAYDDAHSCEKLCAHVFGDEKHLIEQTIEKSNKSSLIFAGGLLKNGVTFSLVNLLNEVDCNNHDYFISYRSWSENIKKRHDSTFNLFPEDISYAPLRTAINPTLLEKLKLNLYLKNRNHKPVPDAVRNLFKREIKRYYGDYKFDNVIHFISYSEIETLLFSQYDGNKIIWSHTDKAERIEKELENPIVLAESYECYDKIAVVSPKSLKSILKFYPKAENKLRLVHNINFYKRTLLNSEKEIEFEDNTVMDTSNPGGIKGVLESPGKKFITVGRFSYEKNHKMLIRAFNKFCNDYPDTQLIIIGGFGEEYISTKRLVNRLKHKKNITLIKSIFNPMPILKECDLFILPSLSEGWPMTIMEADTLKIPVIVSDIEGLQWIRDYDGYLCENSIEGILKAMHDFMDGKVKSQLNIDYDEYNNNAVEEFYEILDK